jgi:hypothetical protein
LGDTSEEEENQLPELDECDEDEQDEQEMKSQKSNGTLEEVSDGDYSESVGGRKITYINEESEENANRD